MRVNCRRMRAVLAAFRPVVEPEGDPDEIEPLRAELQWLGEVLGAARDSEVVRDRLLASVAAQPPELVLGPVEAFLTETFSTRYRAAHDAALETLEQPPLLRPARRTRRLRVPPTAGPPS